MKKIIVIFLFALAALPAADGRSATLVEKPGGVTHRFLDGKPLLAWDPVKGARLYRVAVIDPDGPKGKSVTMAAVWVEVTRYHYGEDDVLPKAGAWKSLVPKALEPGKTYRWMVSAAVTGEKDKGPWASSSFVMPGGEEEGTVTLEDTSDTPAATATATPTPAPKVKPSVTPTPKPDDEFTEEGLEVFDFSEIEGEKEADGESAKDTVDASQSRADSLLQDKKYKEAQAEYLKILAEDKTNADAWEGLGDAYKAQRLKLEAVEAYEKALEIDSKRDHLKDWIKDQRRW